MFTTNKHGNNLPCDNYTGHGGLVKTRSRKTGRKLLNGGSIDQVHDRYHLGQLRTFQRRVKQWRAGEGPDREVFFPQEHRPGEAMDKTNRLRTKRFNEDLAAMSPLMASRAPEFRENDIRVTTRSTISVNYNVYSVPSRLIGEMVRVRVYDDRVEVCYGGKLQITMERLLGRGGPGG